MEYLVALLIFVFGSIIGSFLNVVALRYNTGTTVGGRSMCFSCGKKLAWHELFPILSYLIQSGRCKSCRTKISIQYPIVEALTGLLFVSIFFTYADVLGGGIHLSYGALFQTVLALIIFSILIVTAVYDLRTKIIPNGLAYSFVALSLVQLYFSFGGNGVAFVLPEWADLAAGPVYFLAFAALWFFSQGKWIGLGDAKIALGIGWFLGLEAGGSALMFAFWTGALVGILLILASKLGSRSRRLDFKSEIPFAPFLIIATFFVFYTGITMSNVIIWMSGFLRF